MKTKFVSMLLLLAFLLFPVSAMGDSNYWYLQDGNLRPITNVYGLKIPSLASLSTPCVNVDSNGVFSTTTCASVDIDKVRIVDPGGNGDYTTIASAITAASSGDTVYVTPGLYAESNLPSAAGVTIVGDSFRNTIISASYNGPIISLTDNQIITGIAVINSNTNSASKAINGNGDNILIHNDYISGGYDSIVMNGTNIIVDSIYGADTHYDFFSISGGDAVVRNSKLDISPAIASEASIINGTAGTIRLENNEIKSTRAANEGNLSLARATAGSYTLYDINNVITLNAGTQNAYRYSASLGTMTVYSDSKEYLTGGTTYTITDTANLGTYNIYGGTPITVNGSPTINRLQTEVNASSVEGTDLGTLTDTYVCTYDLASTEIDCNTNPASLGGSGSGNVATSTNEVANNLPIWTSNSATPATLGQVTTGASSTVLISNGTAPTWQTIVFNAISGLLDLATQVTGTLSESNIDSAIARDSELPTQSSLSVDDLITLTGVAEGATDLGTFTGITISDAQTIKAALQEVETALEALSSSTQTPWTGTIDGDGNNLINAGSITAQEIHATSSSVHSTFIAPVEIGEAGANPSKLILKDPAGVWDESGITFGDGDTDVNIKYDDVNILGVNSGGANVKVAGSKSSPAFRFTTDTQTGLYQPSTNNLTFSNLGNDTISFTSGNNVLIYSKLGVATPTPMGALDVNGLIWCEQEVLATTSSPTIDWTSGCNYKLFRMGTAAVDVTFSNYIPGMRLNLEVCNPTATAGALTFNDTIYRSQTIFPTFPTHTTTANACEKYGFTSSYGTSSPILILDAFAGEIQ